ncbi:MAG: ferritin-like domain-containing protein [Deltaproteobacteria bacterium]|nr:ferritin-like domain-containing protein [Deltaproteobacteria bacterium]
MDTSTFIAGLKKDLEGLLAKLKPNETLVEESRGKLEIPMLLKIALKNEMEATLVGARWVENTPETFCKLAFARQVGDESKHYRLIEQRLKELGANLDEYDPLKPSLSPLTEYLLSLNTTLEKAAAGPFAREAIAVVKNAQFISLLKEKGDLATAKLYEETIQVDENYHHQLGENLLLRLVETSNDQMRVTTAVEKTLGLAEELTRLAAEKKGLVRAPGC